MAQEIARHTAHGKYMIDSDTGVVFREGFRCAEGADYTDPYFQKWVNFPEGPKERLAAIRYGVIRDHTDAPDRASVLDFGCGTGDFIMYAREHPSPFNAQGWDVHRNESNRALAHTFLDPGMMPLKVKHWDVLTMFDVIEHIEDPAPILTSIPHQWLVVTVPNADPSLFGGTGAFWRWRHLRPTEHVHHFNATSLPLYLEQFEYTCEYLESPEDEVRVNDEQSFPNTLTGVFRWNGSS
jgi:SAM-dependent methyltransferase